MDLLGSQFHAGEAAMHRTRRLVGRAKLSHATAAVPVLPCRARAVAVAKTTSVFRRSGGWGGRSAAVIELGLDGSLTWVTEEQTGGVGWGDPQMHSEVENRKTELGMVR